MNPFTIMILDGGTSEVLFQYPTYAEVVTLDMDLLDTPPNVKAEIERFMQHLPAYDDCTEELAEKVLARARFLEDAVYLDDYKNTDVDLSYDYDSWYPEGVDGTGN